MHYFKNKNTIYYNNAIFVASLFQSIFAFEIFASLKHKKQYNYEKVYTFIFTMFYKCVFFKKPE